jgi:hypothetical protein
MARRPGAAEVALLAEDLAGVVVHGDVGVLDGDAGLAAGTDQAIGRAGPVMTSTPSAASRTPLPRRPPQARRGIAAIASTTSSLDQKERTGWPAGLTLQRPNCSHKQHHRKAARHADAVGMRGHHQLGHRHRAILPAQPGRALVTGGRAAATLKCMAVSWRSQLW